MARLYYPSEIRVECPNEDCCELIPIDSATPGDPGSYYHPPEPLEISGPVDCPHCGNRLPEDFWDENYEEVLRQLYIVGAV